MRDMLFENLRWDSCHRWRAGKLPALPTDDLGSGRHSGENGVSHTMRHFVLIQCANMPQALGLGTTYVPK